MVELEPSIISTTPGKASAQCVRTGQEMTHGSGSALSMDCASADERRPVVTPFEQTRNLGGSRSEKLRPQASN